jgi:adenylate cyclase
VATEIERKFLVKTETLPDLALYSRVHIVQGYLSLTPAVRVRIEQRLIGSQWEEKAYQTTKGPGLISRKEFEYAIPTSDARELLMLSNTLLIHKTRYFISCKNSNFEVDCFEWPFRGWLAEVEMSSETDLVSLPEWLGEEVTKDDRYSNASLAVKGFPEVPVPKVNPPITVCKSSDVFHFSQGMTINGIAQRMGKKSAEILLRLLEKGFTGLSLNYPLEREHVEAIAEVFGWTLQDG